MTKSKFADLISQQRSEKKDASFKGTFLEYLEVVEKNPKIASLAHRRLFDVLVEDGVDVLDETEMQSLDFSQQLRGTLKR